MRFHDIKKDDFLNGDGMRAVVFVSGCTHACPECHNPVTWNRFGGAEFDEKAKAELFSYLGNDYVSGVTFSGGDPLALYNREEVLSLIKEIRDRFPDKTVWCYTGFTKDELVEQDFWERLKPNIDVLVEGRFEIGKRDPNYHWAGSLNQRVLRTESNFLINTADPIYESLVKIDKDVDSIAMPEMEELYHQTFLEVCRKLNPDAFNQEALEGIRASVMKIKDLAIQSDALTYLSDSVLEACNTSIRSIDDRVRLLEREVTSETTTEDLDMDV